MQRKHKPTDRLPHSWNALIATTFVLIALTVGGAWLLLSHLGARPVDYTAVTEYAAAVLEGTLARAGGNEADLNVTVPVVREEPEGRWTFREFELTLPSPERLTEFRKRLEQEWARRQFEVSEEHDTGALLVGAAGRLFARVNLVAPEPAPAAALELAPAPAPALPPPADPEPASELPEEPPLDLASLPTPPAAQPPGPKPPTEPRPVDVAVVERPRLTVPLPGGPARIAIIVDDGGYGGEATDIILGLDPKLTLAILPRTPYAADTARKAADRGFEVMLHMPMEAERGSAEVLNPLVVGMSPEQILQVTESALADVPGAVGVNNHEGSRYTGDSIAIRGFLEAIGKRGLYFIDSRTSPLSVAGQTSRSLGIPTADRDVFLDNQNNADYIRGQFGLLLKKARLEGSAVGICHFRVETARVLQELLPGLGERENVVLVHASELVR